MGSCVQPLFSSNFARLRGHCRYSAKPSDRAGAGIFVPRPHQIEASKAILAARKAERPGFLLSDMTGLGKTLATWLALADMPETEILIVCPKGAVALWRRTIHLSASPPRDVMIINYERIGSLQSLQADWINYILTIWWLS
jgi:SNF2 family DNA or RNA helicase